MATKKKKMWAWTKKDRRTPLEKEIDRLLTQMAKIDDQTSDRYQKMLEKLDRLMAMQNKQKPKSDREKLSPNTVWVVCGGIVELVIIMTYEKGHVIATKAFSRLLRSRI